MQGMRFELCCLLLTAVVSSLSSGCMRFGYGSREAGEPKPDADVFDAGEIYAGGSGGSPDDAGQAGVAGQSGMLALSGSGGVRAAGSGGAVDSGIVTYPSCPERPGVLFCDSFEAADPSFGHWDYATVTNGTVNRSTAQAKTGAWSLLATTTQGTSAQARMASKVLDHQSSGDAWLRFYNWVPASVQVTSNFSVGILSEAEVPYDGFEPRIFPDERRAQWHGRRRGPQHHHADGLSARALGVCRAACEHRSRARWASRAKTSTPQRRSATCGAVSTS
jgi:hypothetical protein